MRFAEQWSWCTVETVRDVAPTIREFRLRPEDGRTAPYPAGSQGPPEADAILMPGHTWRSI